MCSASDGGATRCGRAAALATCQHRPASSTNRGQGSPRGRQAAGSKQRAPPAKHGGHRQHTPTPTDLAEPGRRAHLPDGVPAIPELRARFLLQYHIKKRTRIAPRPTFSRQPRTLTRTLAAAASARLWLPAGTAERMRSGRHGRWPIRAQHFKPLLRTPLVGRQTC